MKIGILGTGSVARSYHFPALQSVEGAHVIALCDESPKALSLASRALPSARKYNQLTEMLQNETLDLVDIATPGFAHEFQISQCLDRQVAVMVEKPTVVGASSARKLMQLEQMTGQKIYPILNYRYREASLQLHDCMKRGWLGTPEDVTCVQHGGSIYGSPRWAWNEAQTGGLLYEWAFHLIDLCVWLLGPHRRVLGIRSVYEPSLSMHTAISALVEFDHAVATLNFKWFSSASYARLDISGSACDATVKFQPDGFSLRSGDTTPLDELFGEVKRVSKFAFSLLSHRFKKDSYQPHLRVISNVIGSINNATLPAVSMRDVLPTIELVDEMQREMINNAVPLGPGSRPQTIKNPPSNLKEDELRA